MNLFPPVLKKLSEEFPLLRPNIRLIPFPSLLSMIENNQVQAALGVKNEQKPSPLLFRELCSAPTGLRLLSGTPAGSAQSLSLKGTAHRELSSPALPARSPDSLFTIQSGILVQPAPRAEVFC